LAVALRTVKGLFFMTYLLPYINAHEGLSRCSAAAWKKLLTLVSVGDT
jgi:hypothetical protein